jgi:hypothetical protein
MAKISMRECVILFFASPNHAWPSLKKIFELIGLFKVKEKNQEKMNVADVTKQELSRWPTQLAPSNNMDVQVINTLGSMASIIDC